VIKIIRSRHLVGHKVFFGFTASYNLMDIKCWANSDMSCGQGTDCTSK